MHSDQKLGIVLAILLIGFTAAFCFPRNPFNEAELLAVEEDLELDAEIQALPVRAYTSLDAPQSARRNPPAEEITITREEGPAGSNLSETVAPPAIAVPSPVEIGFEVAGFDDDGESDPSGPRPSGLNAPGTDGSSRSSSEPATYTVQYGDTLSGLSIRFLGTSRRYLEIYEANRDVLASPDDLRVGMKLRIPGKNSPRDTAADLEEALDSAEIDRQPERQAESEPAPAVSEAPPRNRTGPPSAAGRFRPVRRSPLTR
ncbi:LysM peptidoglycan-binding domain-containing protein [Maioricimonas sp. JC845]|uniref:LysM peptidoglycan-binding domain-containing protein n=1 Tax=Maioricimonas sp. JC845 TaxID=3232138 RepID=UPI0034579102